MASQVVNVSDPEWAPYFIQYKTLKQHIKAIRAETDANGSQDGSPCRSAGGDSSRAGSPAAAGRARATTEDRAGLEDATLPAAQRKTMSESAPEVAFFRALRAELQKSSKFFTSAERVLEIRRERVHEALRMLKRAAEPCGALCKPGLLEDDDARALAACVAYYRDLLLLENYAIINYCGFSKILKKHDKQTGFTTRTQFMRVCVAPQPFTRYPRLMEMIREAEDLYRDIAAASDRIRGTRSVDPPPLSPSSSSQQLSTLGGVGAAETDALDAILNLREAASRIREGEEDPDAAAAAAAPAAAAPCPAFAGPAADLERLHKTTSPPPKRART